jgi:hypothetical protein
MFVLGVRKGKRGEEVGLRTDTGAVQTNSVRGRYEVWVDSDGEIRDTLLFTCDVMCARHEDVISVLALINISMPFALLISQLVPYHHIGLSSN